MIHKLGSEKTVLVLLKNQADIKIRNGKNQTPRDVAIEQGYSKIADLLMKAKKNAESGKLIWKTMRKNAFRFE